MDPSGRKGDTCLAIQISQSTLVINGVTEVAARSPSTFKGYLKTKGYIGRDKKKDQNGYRVGKGHCQPWLHYKNDTKALKYFHHKADLF